jgi:hypothetical protein
VYLSLPNGPFPSGFPTLTPYAVFLLALRAIFPAHRILRYLISRIIAGEEHKF